MVRRRLVASPAIAIVLISGLALFSNFTAKVSGQGLQPVFYDLPADSHFVFGMNVQAFLASPVYAQFAQQHAQEITAHLSEFIAATGVDPQRDIQYVVGAARQKESGVVIASGTLDSAKITSFAQSKGAAAQAFHGVTILTPPETHGLQKGVALISNNEIAAGDLDSVQAVILAHQSGGNGANQNLAALLGKVDSRAMVSFAGDPTGMSIPATTSQIPALSAVQSFYGNLSIDTSLKGQVTVIAKDETTAGQLAKFAQGLVAMASLANKPDLAQLVNGLTITQNGTELNVTLNIPVSALEKVHALHRLNSRSK